MGTASRTLPLEGAIEQEWRERAMGQDLGSQLTKMGKSKQALASNNEFVKSYLKKKKKQKRTGKNSNHWEQ